MEETYDLTTSNEPISHHPWKQQSSLDKDGVNDLKKMRKARGQTKKKKKSKKMTPEDDIDADSMLSTLLDDHGAHHKVIDLTELQDSSNKVSGNSNNSVSSSAPVDSETAVQHPTKVDTIKTMQPKSNNFTESKDGGKPIEKERSARRAVSPSKTAEQLQVPVVVPSTNTTERVIELMKKSSEQKKVKLTSSPSNKLAKAKQTEDDETEVVQCPSTIRKEQENTPAPSTLTGTNPFEDDDSIAENEVVDITQSDVQPSDLTTDNVELPAPEKQTAKPEVVDFPNPFELNLTELMSAKVEDGFLRQNNGQANTTTDNICDAPSIESFTEAFGSAVSAVNSGTQMVSKMIAKGTKKLHMKKSKKSKVRSTDEEDEDGEVEEVEIHISDNASHSPIVAVIKSPRKNKDNVLNTKSSSTNSQTDDDSYNDTSSMIGSSDDDDMESQDQESSVCNGEEEEEDVVESSKRLLMMADKRLQYQKYNDEVKKLKEDIATMKEQAGALTEQLRRAVETKCDLVVAQTEMERMHEMQMMAKDDAIKALKAENTMRDNQTTKLELKFMNDMNVLSDRLNNMDRCHRNEILEKDYEIANLEQKLNRMQTESVRRESPRAAFRSRFLNNGSSASSQSSGSRAPHSP